MTRPWRSMARTKPPAGRSRLAPDDRHDQRIGGCRSGGLRPTSSALAVGIDDERAVDPLGRGTSAKRIDARAAEAVGEPDHAAEGVVAALASSDGSSAGMVGRVGPRRQRLEPAPDRRSRRSGARSWSAASAVARSAIGRSASSARRMMRRAVSTHRRASCGAEAQPLSTTRRSGPVPGASSVGRLVDRAGKRDDHARRRGGRRSAVSHHGRLRRRLFLRRDLEEEARRREALRSAAAAASPEAATRSPAARASATRIGG